MCKFKSISAHWQIKAHVHCNVWIRDGQRMVPTFLVGLDKEGLEDRAGLLLEGVEGGSPKYFCLLKHYF